MCLAVVFFDLTVRCIGDRNRIIGAVRVNSTDFRKLDDPSRQTAGLVVFGFGRVAVDYGDHFPERLGLAGGAFEEILISGIADDLTVGVERMEADTEMLIALLNKIGRLSGGGWWTPAPRKSTHSRRLTAS